MISRVMKLMTLAALALCCSLGAYAQQEVKIGVIYPLTGPAASTGAELKDAIELAADIINNGAKNIPSLPLSLGGACPV